MQKRIKLLGLSLAGAFFLIGSHTMLAGELAPAHSTRLSHKGGEVRVQHGTAGSLALKDVLEMNDSQIAQVQQESAFFEQRINPLREQFGQLEEKSRAAENAGDANTLGQAILDRAPIQKQMEAERAAHRDRVLALLTADQKAKVNQMTNTLQAANGAYSVLNALGLVGEGGGMISHTSERGRGTIRHQK